MEQRKQTGAVLPQCWFTLISHLKLRLHGLTLIKTHVTGFIEAWIVFYRFCPMQTSFWLKTRHLWNHIENTSYIRTRCQKTEDVNLYKHLTNTQGWPPNQLVPVRWGRGLWYTDPAAATVLVPAVARSAGPYWFWSWPGSQFTAGAPAKPDTETSNWPQHVHHNRVSFLNKAQSFP